MVEYRIVERRSPPDGAEDARPGMTDLGGILDITEDPLDEPDLLWFIEPKDREPSSEFQRQSTFLAMLSRLGPECSALAIPNAGKATDWERIQRWKEGARAGALDLQITWQTRGIFFAEFKDGKKMPDRNQRRRLNTYFKQGHYCGVYRKAETLIAHLRNVGAPIREARI